MAIAGTALVGRLVIPLISDFFDLQEAEPPTPGGSQSSANAAEPVKSPAKSPCRPKMKTPPEKDFALRVFQIVNPEGEIHTIDTADVSSPFYGPVWTRIFDAYLKGAFLRGRAFTRRISCENRFSGYSVSIDGIEAFLPQSKSHFFYDTERDATNKCIALKVEMVYPNGAHLGRVIVDAKAPWKQAVEEFRKMAPGKAMYALAVDHEEGMLIFPGPRSQNIFVSADEALKLAEKSGAAAVPDFLTGLYWRLELRSLTNGKWLARPLEILL
jgi:hypothetical protein